MATRSLLLDDHGALLSLCDRVGCGLGLLPAGVVFGLAFAVVDVPHVVFLVDPDRESALGHVCPSLWASPLDRVVRRIRPTFDLNPDDRARAYTRAPVGRRKPTAIAGVLDLLHSSWAEPSPRSRSHSWPPASHALSRSAMSA